jgi:hypothetical protein
LPFGSKKSERREPALVLPLRKFLAKSKRDRLSIVATLEAIKRQENGESLASELNLLSFLIRCEMIRHSRSAVA